MSADPKKEMPCTGARHFLYCLIRLLVSSCKEHAACRRLTSNHTGARCGVALEGDTTDSSLGLLLDALLSLGSAVPVSKHEATLLNLFLELLVGSDLQRIIFHIHMTQTEILSSSQMDLSSIMPITQSSTLSTQETNIPLEKIFSVM